MQTKNKVTSMAEAIARFIHDGDTVYIGGFFQQIPYAAVHELLRQNKKNLTVSTCAGLIAVDLLIGAGCVSKVISSFVWNPIPKPAYNFKRAMEQGIPRHVELREYSLLSLVLAYFAGALNLPFVTTKSLLGSDMLHQLSCHDKNEPKIIESPFTGEKVCAIAPLKHDIGIVQLQRADKEGNGQGWGALGDCRYGINSCSKIVLCVEEIADKDEIISDPNRTIVPSFKVCAVVEVPWGAHPAPMVGYYDTDWAYHDFYAEATKTMAGFKEYLAEWVYGVADRKAYLERIGSARLEKLKVSPHHSKPVNYGRHKAWKELR